MVKFIIIILTVACLLSCSSPDRRISNLNIRSGIITLNEMDISLYKPDTNYTVKGKYSPSALKDIKLGHRLAIDKMSQYEIIKYKIKSIQEVGLYIEKFDEQGLKIFEKWDAWSAGSKFKYKFGKSGKPLAISMIDSNDSIIGTARYKYDSQGKLLQAGDYVLKYYSTGQLKSVENAAEIEGYEYDGNGNLNHIVFGIKPGVVGCGNSIIEWKGEYNEEKQLIKEQVYGLSDETTTYFYTPNGQISKTESAFSIGYEKYSTTFVYMDGLLVQTKTFDQAGKLKSEVKWIYEKY